MKPISQGIRFGLTDRTMNEPKKETKAKRCKTPSIRRCSKLLADCKILSNNDMSSARSPFKPRQKIENQPIANPIKNNKTERRSNFVNVCPDNLKSNFL